MLYEILLFSDVGFNKICTLKWAHVSAAQWPKRLGHSCSQELPWCAVDASSHSFFSVPPQLGRTGPNDRS